MSPDDRSNYDDSDNLNEGDFKGRHPFDDEERIDDEEAYKGHYADEPPGYEKEDDEIDEGFFNDNDFELKGFDEEEYEDEDGFRSSRTRAKKKRRRLIFSSIAIMALLVLIAIGIVFGYRFIKNKYFAPQPGPDTSVEEAIIIPSSIKLANDMSIIIAGAKENLAEPQINSVIFSKYNAAKSEMISLCIPVNTLFEIPGFGLDNLASSAEYGGMDLMKLTIKNNTGMDVNNYMLLDVVNVVDRLEGIKLRLDSPVTVSASDGSKLEFKEGDNILNGEAAHKFLDYFNGTVHNVGISGIEMHKILFDSIMQKIVGTQEEDFAKNLARIKDYIETDLNQEALAEFVSTVFGLEKTNNKVYSLDGRVEPIDEAGNVVFVPDISRVNDIFSQEGIQQEQQFVYETGETVSVIVLNGVGTKGIAGKVSEMLENLNFSDGTARYEMATPGNADNDKYTATQILLKSSDESLVKASEHLKSVLLTGNVIVVEEGSTQQTDIVLIIGRDFNYENAASNLSQEASVETVQETAQEQDVQGQVYRLIVLNGEGTQGIASTVTKIITDDFNKEDTVIEALKPRNADNSRYTSTRILIHTDKAGNENIAERIKAILGVGTVSTAQDNPDNVDITIIVGSDYTK